MNLFETDATRAYVARTDWQVCSFEGLDETHYVIPLTTGPACAAPVTPGGMRGTFGALSAVTCEKCKRVADEKGYAHPAARQ